MAKIHFSAHKKPSRITVKYQKRIGGTLIFNHLKNPRQ